MTYQKYIQPKYPTGLYAELWIDSMPAAGNENNVQDACNWKMLHETYNNAMVTEGHQKWKAAALQGMRFAITKIETRQPNTITLMDVMAHILHSNLHSIFAAGFMAVFKELNVEIKEQDLTNLQQFVYSSRGFNNIWVEPDENKLLIDNYKA